MSVQKLILSIVVVLFVLSSCEKQKCLYGSGEETTLITHLDSFKVLEVYGMFDVELISDTTWYVEMTNGENVLKNTEIEFKDDTLRLYDYNSCFWMRDYQRTQFKIHFDDISRIDLHETCYLFSTDSITDNFLITVQTQMAESDITFNAESVFIYVHHYTGGKYVFRGKTDRLRILGFYSSIFDASELEAKTALIQHHSVADYKIWATDLLNVEMWNKGNLYYRGNPAIQIDTLVSTGYIYSLD